MFHIKGGGPTLPVVTIFSREIPTYGLLTGLGLLLAVLCLKLAERRVPSLGADGELALVYAILGAAVGAKLLYLVTVFPLLLHDLPVLFSNPALFLRAYLSGGFVFYGGFFGCVGAVWLYCRVQKIEFGPLAKLMLPMFPLIHAFGRVGCFCEGCCYGVPADPPLGVAFQQSRIAPNGVPLLPVQLYEAALELGLFIWLARMSKGAHTGTQMLWRYCAAYGAARFGLEFLRGDAHRGFLGPLSTSQVIALVTLAACALTLIRPKRAV